MPLKRMTENLLPCDPELQRGRSTELVSVATVTFTSSSRSPYSLLSHPPYLPSPYSTFILAASPTVIVGLKDNLNKRGSTHFKTKTTGNILFREVRGANEQRISQSGCDYGRSQSETLKLRVNLNV